MVYGRFIMDSTGQNTFFAEGCLYCDMTTSGQHSPDCPLNPNNTEAIKKALQEKEGEK